MSTSTNEKLAKWIKEKVNSEYADDISMVLLYGSFINGTANPRSDLDCYYIPRTERGYRFARTFIIDGTGYDIFPMDWERVTRIANLKEDLLPLVGDVTILYSASEKDLHRFQRLQTKLRENLADSRITRAAVQEKIRSAYGRYQDMRRTNSLSEIRKLAGCVIMELAEAAVIYNHDYFHFGLKTQFQDLQKLQQTKGIPGRICEEYLQTIQAKTAEESIGHCYCMLCAVKDYTCPDAAVPEPEKEREAARETAGTDFAALAGLYEEISSTFNKIYVCCENGNYVLAYLSAVCLQRELDEAHRECGSNEYDILSSYEWDDLQKIDAVVQEAENDFVRFITDGGGEIKRYRTFEEFEKMESKEKLL